MKLIAFLPYTISPRQLGTLGNQCKKHTAFPEEHHTMLVRLRGFQQDQIQTVLFAVHIEGLLIKTFIHV